MSSTIEHEMRQKEKAEIKALFEKLGLDYENDVPKAVKSQLRTDKNAKKILIGLTEEEQGSKEVDTLNEYLNKSVKEKEDIGDEDSLYPIKQKQPRISAPIKGSQSDSESFY